MEAVNVQQWLSLLLTLVIVVLVFSGMRWILLSSNKELSADQKLPRQLILMLILIVSIVAIVLSLPISEGSRNQLLALLGVLLSGVLAFSSTTIVSNLMAGVILRVNRPFRTGDFIVCDKFSGRVSEQGILDTEIQTPQRTLIHIANSFLINHPVEVTRSSGTFIYAEISIGYDVHHHIVEKHLKSAAEKAELSDVFAHIVALGDFSVSYKVSGLLNDTKSLLTTKSRLHACILDELHNHNIEIMSPNVMAQRPLDPSLQFIAKSKAKVEKETSHQEDIAFDKAEEAERFEMKKLALQDEIKSLKESLQNKNTNTELSEEQKLKLNVKLEATENKLTTLLNENSEKDK